MLLDEELVCLSGLAVPLSVEASPATATADRLAVLAERGATRLSLGVVQRLTPELTLRGGYTYAGAGDVHQQGVGLGLSLDFDDRETHIEAVSEEYHPYEYQTENNGSWAGALPVKQ